MDPVWKTLDWSTGSKTNGLRDVDLREEAAKFVSEDPELREDAHDFFAQWPVELRECFGRLDAIPILIRLIGIVINSENRENKHRDIELLESYLRNLHRYEGCTNLYVGSMVDFRGAFFVAMSNLCPLLRKQLLHDDPLVRDATIRLFLLWNDTPELSKYCDEEIHNTIFTLISTDKDPNCVASAIRFSVHGEPHTGLHNTLSGLTGSRSSMVKQAACWGLCKIDGLEAHSPCFEFLCKQCLLWCYGDKQLSREDDLAEMSLSNSAFDFILDLGSAAVDSLIETGRELVLQVSEANVFPFYNYLTRVAFESRGMPPSDLSSIQKNLLSQIAEDERFWGEGEFEMVRYFNNPFSQSKRKFRSDMLENLGLPASRAKLKGFLQSE